jgi:hypothetical protein
MGRFADLGSFLGSLTPLDLFRYTGPGARQLTVPAGSPCGNFSVDGGVTNINSFNCGNGGDLGDWSGLTVDSFNASPHWVYRCRSLRAISRNWT